MDRFSLFATPVMVFDAVELAPLNVELAELLLAERAGEAGTTRSNVGGWHSAPNLAKRQEPCFQRLMEVVVDYVAAATRELALEAGSKDEVNYRFGVHGWAMVMGPGDYAVLHEHGDAHWSAVYYIDAGDDVSAEHPQSGLLAFVDPKHGARPLPRSPAFPTTFSVRARTGSLVLFPGWLQHFVHPYRGTRPRISMSCNVVLE